MKASPFLLFVLVGLAAWTLPTVQAATPPALKTVTGSLNPGDISSFSWDLNSEVSDFLFHYRITGGAEAEDVVYVSIDETGDYWPFLMGEGWAYCDCPLSMGPYTITVEADAAATGRISFDVGFYAVGEPPLDFTGFMPANSGTRISGFAAVFPFPAVNYSLTVDVTDGSYEFFIDGSSEGVVEGTRTLTLQLEEGFHLFEVDSSVVGVDETVRWAVQGGEVIPEFPPFVVPLILVMVVTLTALASRRSRRTGAAQAAHTSLSRLAFFPFG